jgi:hypothetical protein
LSEREPRQMALQNRRRSSSVSQKHLNLVIQSSIESQDDHPTYDPLEEIRNKLNNSRGRASMRKQPIKFIDILAYAMRENHKVATDDKHNSSKFYF